MKPTGGKFIGDADLNIFFENNRCGLKTSNGHVVIAAEWKRLEQLRRNYWLTVTDAGLMGVVRHDAKFIVTPMPPREMWSAFQAHMKNATAHVWAEISKDPRRSLAAFTDVFDALTERLDLVDAGLWERAVEILEDCKWNGMQCRGADIGRIGWRTGGRTLYDLAKEAPVEGLGDHQGSLGVSWAMLRPIDEK